MEVLGRLMETLEMVEKRGEKSVCSEGEVLLGCDLRG